ncbi:hypothetical protein NAPIS_ORF00549 [Vairimorpha apis BRL 01]|uniref:Uncharacterized protein n=1 Tax=Vairimorpha apis BRL 01 TaxID=1037528 RepID=T0LC71_9MICR|nr:hypothetical protein NAPIS_ORF00549 [Vairimorpha apis BRL 01]
MKLKKIKNSFSSIDSNILVINKKSKEILIVERETEKLRKYDLLANELGLIQGCKTRIIPYVLTWDGLVTKYHTKYRKALEISDRIEAYIQSYRRRGDLILAENERNENLHTK